MSTHPKTISKDRHNPSNPTIDIFHLNPLVTTVTEPLCSIIKMYLSMRSFSSVTDEPLNRCNWSWCWVTNSGWCQFLESFRYSVYVWGQKRTLLGINLGFSVHLSSVRSPVSHVPYWLSVSCTRLSVSLLSSCPLTLCFTSSCREKEETRMY